MMDSLRNAGLPPIWRDAQALVLLCCATLKIMANVAISPALAGLAVAFSSAPMAGLLTRLLVPAPSVAVMVLAPLAGLVADRFGRRRLLAAGIFVLAVAGSAGLYLPDLWSILGSRVVVGVALAMVMTAQAALVGDLLSGERRSTFLSWQVAAINFGGAVFIGLSGILAGLSPRLPFAIYALAFVLLPLLLVFLPADGVRRVERSGGVAVGTGAAATGGARPGARPGARAEEEGWGLPVTAVSALAFLSVFLFFMMPTQLPFFLQGVGLDSASMTAYALMALTVTGGIAAFLHRHALRHTGLGGTYAMGYGLMAGGYVLLALPMGTAVLLVATALIGAGYALVMPNLMIQALDLAPAGRRGLVSGFVTTALFAAQFLSPLVLTPLIDGWGYGRVFVLAASLYVALALVSSTAGRWTRRQVAQANA